MKTRTARSLRRFQLQILGYGNCYYIDRVADLERALVKKPRQLHIELVGVGEILPDAALRIRAALLARSPQTQIITNARSSLHGSSVLVWLLGDRRLLRDDAKVYFRRTNWSEREEPKTESAWKDDEPNPWDTSSDVEPEEADYARVLQLINEFLPVNELAGRFIEAPTLKQFGLLDNERIDHFLATAFRRDRETTDVFLPKPEKKRARNKAAEKKSI